MPPMVQAWALPAALLAIAKIAGTWYKLVSSHVPDPYMDEVFHVPQAQRYCKSDFTWDQKITTPPGLYIVSLLLKPAIGGCDTSSLRILNVGAICVICLLSYDILRILRRGTPAAPKEREGNSVGLKTANDDDPTVLLDAHSALNISLLPPLFFFSGLYYTDVLSTLFVLLSYRAYLKRTSANNLLGFFVRITIGVAALLFRQTNIFWIAVFPAGLAIVDALKEQGQPVDARKLDSAQVLTCSWSKGIIHDPFAFDASVLDYVLFLATTAIAAIQKPIAILRSVSPYLVLLALFGGFVVWNGGVVLGDKSNHVATIHVPQMLYIWPYILFFSFPLALAPVLGLLSRQLPRSLLKTLSLENFIGGLEICAPGPLSAFLFITIGLIAVHFNTIVHPFTLADNRHYVFYVFRILRRHYAIKYGAVPFYYLCSWLAIQTIGAVPRGSGPPKRSSNSKPTVGVAHRPPCRASFIVVWVITTALSVISAPLVEPRYFIIPWIIWRLHVPATPASPSRDPSTGKVSHDLRLVLETLWLLAVNGAAGFTFLNREFAWNNEPGLQRFLW
ncbi:glycosyltransferase family 59 protein [Amniculicola lignicola CBS 123094]|uniref:Dol-P-Glc:Glc(2)Man(9)GlcNAc(2)-PP-Dol alpha-1,2-glucosyltransferase n=1 Tax=Amniculicola lignicola CBS 123094 TaxID=1392246 RepID=A0A6A5W6L7_9PLEO|nr:glycosyltransferase family 59 protein [Amniculicola lignicola CBS 123094]